jgi:hypothetical protein
MVAGPKLKLSASGMRNIAQSKAENDFTFIIGDASYKCPWFVATFLSPRIGQLRSMDPTVTEYVIETEDPEHQFEEFLSLGRGDFIEVSERSRQFLISVSSELGNFELYFSIHDWLQQTVTVPGFCQLLSGSETEDYFSEKSIEFLAVHFNELVQSVLIGLPISVLSRILSHPSLTLESEDSLYEFVISQFESHPDSLSLLAHVRFEFLSSGTMAKFGLWSCDHFESFEFSLPLWWALLKRLSQTASLLVPDRTRHRKMVGLREGSPRDGIIAEWTRVAGGNVHDRGVVEIATSSAEANHPARDAVDLDQKNYFQSSDSPNQWLRYDFNDRRIRLTDYSIAAVPTSWFLHSWVVEGSEDGSTWTTLDERQNNNDANYSHPIATFKAEREKELEWRFIRLRQTGNSYPNRNNLILHGFEVFGLVIGGLG